MKYVSVGEMIQIEQASDAAGHSYQAMMEAAGWGLAEKIQENYGTSEAQRITAVIGSGNNGGDALVALELLHGWGWETSALVLKAREEDDPLVRRYQHSGGRLILCHDPESCGDVIARELSRSDVLVDGLLGTGIRLPVRGELALQMGKIKEWLSSQAVPPWVVAVDCPSGVDCDTGAVDEVCFPADLTVTMAAVKQGLLKFPAYGYLGDLTLVDIGLPEGLEPWERISREVVDYRRVEGVLPRRPLDAHKGTFGTALIVAGSVNYTGAAYLTGAGAYRVGAGLVEIAAPEGVRGCLAGRLPEAIWLVLGSEEGGIAGGSTGNMAGSLARATALCLGPGLGTREGTVQFVGELVGREDLPPVVVDADGLRALAEKEDGVGLLPAPAVLTPHPGEMAALTGLSVEEIQEDRVSTAEQFAAEWGHVVVLKGALTVIAAPGGRTMVIPVANSALAAAGTGDVLAGLITGLMAQGAAPFQAAYAGAWIHAWAGASAADQLGTPTSVLAGDVLAGVSEVLAGLDQTGA